MCYHVVAGIGKSKIRSKDDIIFIESSELQRVSRDGTGITVEYFDHNNEWKLKIIALISSCDLVIYIFVGPMKKNNPVLFHHP